MKRLVAVGLALMMISGGAFAQTIVYPPPGTVPPEAAPRRPSTRPTPRATSQPNKTLGAAAQSAARKAIAAQYASVESAALRNKLPGIMKVVAPDFQYFDLSGNVTDRVGYERLEQETLITRTKLRYRYTIKSIEWREGDAIVQVENRMTGVYDYKQFDLRISSRDYWSPTPQGWKIRQRVDLSMRGFFNGQRVSGSYGQSPSQNP